MKYYYGNDYKEALSNNPVEIKDMRILQQYRECYSCVISVDDDLLPETVRVNIAELEYDPKENDLEELVTDWLRDTFGYFPNDYCWEYDKKTGEIIIDNIDWFIDEDD